MQMMNQQQAQVCSLGGVYVCIYVCVVKGKGQVVTGAMKKNKTG